jgi:hypothetical protein
MKNTSFVYPAIFLSIASFGTGAPGEPSWPSTMREGTKRTPSGRAAFGDVALFWYTRPGNRPLVSTRGQAVDHLAFAVRNLDGWIAKLKREDVTFLREPYAFGDSRAVMIEGPSHEAIEHAAGP